MSIFRFLLSLSLIFFVKQDDSLYKIPIDIMGQNFIPVIPIYINEYSLIPKLLTIDINLDQSWIFNSSLENIDNNKFIVKIKHAFYMIAGNNKKGTIYLNKELKIDDFNYLDINQIYDEINNSGALSLSVNLDKNNIINLLKFKDDSTTKKSQFFGFCLDFTNLNKNKPYLYIGDLSALNKDISKLQKFPLFEGDSEDNKEKQKKKVNWSIKLKGLFIGSVNSTFNESKGEQNVNLIDNKKNKGLIIDEPAVFESIYNYIYITKEAMLFLGAYYFSDKKDICKREEINDENTYEIKYNCLRNKRQNLNNINLILDNNITIELTQDDLLNCAVNKYIDSKQKYNLDTCEFSIRYHNNINYYALGLPILRKYKTYFLYNDESILIENNQTFSQSYLEEKIFTNISRKKKKNIGQTLKVLFNTTLCIAFIFSLLTGGFYLYDKFRKKNEYEQKEEIEKIINRNKYANL